MKPRQSGVAERLRSLLDESEQGLGRLGDRADLIIGDESRCNQSAPIFLVDDSCATVRATEQVQLHVNERPCSVVERWWSAYVNREFCICREPERREIPSVLDREPDRVVSLRFNATIGLSYGSAPPRPKPSAVLIGPKDVYGPTERLRALACVRCPLLLGDPRRDPILSARDRGLRSMNELDARWCEPSVVIIRTSASADELIAATRRLPAGSGSGQTLI